MHNGVVHHCHVLDLWSEKNVPNGGDGVGCTQDSAPDHGWFGSLRWSGFSFLLLSGGLFFWFCPLGLAFCWLRRGGWLDLGCVQFGGRLDRAPHAFFLQHLKQTLVLVQPFHYDLVEPVGCPEDWILFVLGGCHQLFHGQPLLPVLGKGAQNGLHQTFDRRTRLLLGGRRFFGCCGRLGWPHFLSWLLGWWPLQ